MNYIENINTLKLNANTVHGKKLCEKMRSDVKWFSENFTDDPQILSGWGHQYFCADDGAFLNFDVTMPKSHVCPVCGKTSSEENFNAAWVYMYRYQALMSALEAASLYCLEENPKYLNHFMRIVGFYSDNYAKFAEHGKGPTTSGNGKITPQALNEAIFLAKTVNGLEMLKDVLPKEFIESVSDNLLIPGALFVNAQKHIIHNIPCWINAGVGTVGLFTQNADLIKKAFDAPLGLCDQVRQGVTESFFWYEGSIHYNCFTIESFLNLFLFAKLYNYSIPHDVSQTVYNMMLAPCKMAFSSSVLPNPNDGWPNLNLKTYSYLYEMASKIFESDELRNITANIYSQKAKRTPLPMSSPIYEGDYCMEWLLFSNGNFNATPLELWQKSTNFEASNYATLRKNNIEVFIKYGHCSPSHAHPDKMNIEISAFNTLISRDLSNCGYAARLCNEYHRTSVSHNTVVINGQTHPTTEKGVCVSYNQQESAIHVRANEAYHATNFERIVKLSDNGFTDLFLVKSENDNNADWFFHTEGELSCAPICENANIGYSDNGYQHLQNIRKIITDEKQIDLVWTFANKVKGTQTLALENVSAYICESYDNPVNKFRTAVILRSNGKNASFNQSWKFEQL